MEIQEAVVKIKPIKKRKFQITIKGESPLVMHAWSEKAKAMVRMTPQERKKLPKVERTPEQTAHECAYRMDDGSFGLPIDAFKKAITEAAHVDYGVPKKLIRSAFFIEAPDKSNNVPLSYVEEPVVTEDKVTVGRGQTDLRYRLYFYDWKATYTCEIDTSMLNIQDVLTLVNKAGFGVGIGDWRPQRDGDKGRFVLDPDAGLVELDPDTNQVIAEAV